MDWVYLLLAIVCELCGTFCFKLTSVTGKPFFFVGVTIGYAFAFWFFGLCLKTIDVSIAYAVWSGIGIVGTSIVGILYFNETAGFTKLLYIALILFSVIGLNLADKH